MKRRFEPFLSAGAWLCGVLAVVPALLVRLYSPDLWWHLAAGRAMVATQAFLRTDIFSHTRFGAPWINFEWLSEILLFGLYRMAGYWGLYAAKVLLCAAVLALLWAILRRVGSQGPMLFLLLWTGFKVVQPRLLGRPELASLVFLGILVWLLLWARSAKTPRVRYVPVFIFALMVAWVNLHAGFVYGVGLLGLLCGGAVWAKEDRAYQRLLFKSLAAAVVALLFNPYGVKLGLVFWEHYQQLKANPSYIDEWQQPAVWQIPYFWMLYVMGAVALVVGLVRGRREVKLWAPAVFVFTVWGTFFYRNAALLAFVGLPFLGGALRLKKYTWAAWVFALCLTVPAAWRARPYFPAEPVKWYALPVRACDFVRDNNIQGTMFNTYGAGGYIEWALGPERRVFMDGRYLFYPLLSEYVRLVNDVRIAGLSGGEWPAYLDDKGVDYAIMEYPTSYFAPSEKNGLPFHLSLLNVFFPRHSWALVFWDDSALVFVRRTPAFKKLIDRCEYSALWPYNAEQMAVLLRQRSVKAAQAAAELERHRRETGFTILGQQMENLLKTASPPQ